MLFVQRRHLHRQVAEWYERTYRGDPAPYYAILAHHWRHGDEPAKAIEYLEKAGRSPGERCFPGGGTALPREPGAGCGVGRPQSAYYGDGAAHAGPDSRVRCVTP